MFCTPYALLTGCPRSDGHRKILTDCTTANRLAAVIWNAGGAYMNWLRSIVL